MRACTAVGLVVGLIFTAQVGTIRGDPGKETDAEKIARLIQQLGDDAFRKREAASKELDAIGEPALVALRKAAASSDDAEIRRRAERISETIAARVAEAGAKPELAKLQGVWKQVGAGCTITIIGDKWVQKWPTGDGGAHVHSGILKILNAGKTPLAVDWIHHAGSYVGSTTLTLVQVDGDTLKECWRGDGVRPTEFAAKEGFPQLVTYKRQKQ